MPLTRVSGSSFPCKNAKPIRGSGWAATTKDKDYIRMVGLKHVVNNLEHRKELVAGNLSEFVTRGRVGWQLL